MADYYTREELTRKELLGDPNFVKDAQEFLLGRTKRSYDTDDKLFDAFVEHMRVGMINEVTALRDRSYVKKVDDDTKEQAGRLFLAFDRLGKGSTSTATMIGDYAQGLLAPSTALALIPYGGVAAKLGAKATTQGLAMGTRLLATQSIKRRAAHAAGTSALIEGGIGGIQGLAYASARKETGVDEYKDISVPLHGAFGAGLGAVTGGTIGGISGALAARHERKAALLPFAGTVRKEMDVVWGAAAKETLIAENKEARAMIKALKGRFKGQTRDPLPESMTTPGAALREVSSEDFRLTMKPEVLNNLEGAFTESLLAFGAKATDIGNKPITEILGNAMERQLTVAGKTKGSTVTPWQITTNQMDIIQTIQKKYGLTPHQFNQMFQSTFSDAGKQLAFASKMARHQGEAARKETELLLKKLPTDQLPPEIENLVPPSAIRSWIRNVDKFRLGTMTAQTATTARNASGGIGRLAGYLTDNMFQGGLELLDPTISAQARQRAKVKTTSGLRAFKALVWNPAEAQLLQRVFHATTPEKYTDLFRANADIAVAVGPGSKLANFGRKLNVLNTFVDNIGKRSVFYSELTTQVGGKKELDKILLNNTFEDIPVGQINNAIKAANQIAYQRTYKEKMYRPVTKRVGGVSVKVPLMGRKRIGGRDIETGEYEELALKDTPSDFLWFSDQAVSNAVKALSTPVTTPLLPFAKFLMNSLEFSYRHAPVVGMLRKGPVINKQKISEQLTGTALLYAAIQYRAAQGPTAEWWEEFNPDTGEYANALPIYAGFGVYMLFADLILRSTADIKDEKYWLFPPAPVIAGTKKYRERTAANWDRVLADPWYERMFSKKFFQDFLKGTLNASFRTGIGLEFTRKIADELSIIATTRDAEGKVTIGDTLWNDATKRALKRFGASYAGTFMVPFGEVRDLYAQYDPQYEEIRDPNAVVNSADLFMSLSLRALPMSSETVDGKPVFGTGKYFGLLPAPAGAETLAVAPTKVPGVVLRREGGLQKQFSGLGSVQVKNLLEEQLALYDIQKYKATPKITGVPPNSLHRKHKLLYQEYVRDILLPFLAGNPAYTTVPEDGDTDSSKRSKKRILMSQLSEMQSWTRSALAHQVNLAYNATPDNKQNQDELLHLLGIGFRGAGNSDVRKQAKAEFKRISGRNAANTGEQGVEDTRTLILMAKEISKEFR